MLNNCPHCDSEDVSIISHEVKDKTGYRDYTVNYALCTKCKLQGPSFYGQSTDRAVEVWNKIKL